VTEKWISDETEPKEADFRGILRMHIHICKGILGRYGGPPYLYVDLYAGPGNLEYGGSEFLGSPLIAQEELVRAGIAYESVHFERDAAVAAELEEALLVPRSVLWWPEPDSTHVFAEACQEGFPRWLASAGRQPNRYGLIYADPIRDEIPVALLNQAASLMPKVDLLSYVAATQYKRRRGADLKLNGASDKPLLSDHIGAVNKKYAVIRRPRDAWQFTFILWSNWDNLPEWTRAGFYRLDSPAGAQILDQLDLTAAEHHRKVNTPLPFDDGPPYRTYREYLKHPRFLAVRVQVFERAAGTCERCHERPPTEPHHLVYPPWGTFDVPENMIAVCHQCHCEIHGKAA
jgi:hypothetical protein